MNQVRKLFLFSACAVILFSTSSCSVWHKVFGPKYGCPANGRAFGAERILSGEKPPKTRKFKA
ncbi:MAG: hypothetical protein ABI415_02110 [Flavitalea sp.]